MTVTDVAEQPPVITSSGGVATAALLVPEIQGAGRRKVDGLTGSYARVERWIWLAVGDSAPQRLDRY